MDLNKRNGWIAVDLDGTLAYYESYRPDGSIGPPIPRMVERVQKWMAEGWTVKIFTARAGHPEQIERIQAWALQHTGFILEVTNVKDMHMVELWDDRCVRVQPNTGMPCCEFWRHVQ